MRAPSTMWSLPAVSLPANGEPHHHCPVQQCGSGEPCEPLCLCVLPLPACPPTHHPALHPWEGTYAQAPNPGQWADTMALPSPPVFMSRLWRLSSTGTTLRTCLPTRLVVGSLALRWQCRTKIKNGFIRVIAVEVSLGCFAGSGCPNVLWETCEEHTICNSAFSRMF